MTRVEEAAAAYVLARRRCADAAGIAAVHEAQIALAYAYHDLELLVLGACSLCDPGTCPGLLEHLEPLQAVQDTLPL